jgi:hypothetical protein
MTIFSPLPGSRGPRSWPPVRCQEALLSRQSLSRSTPITTTALLPFTVRLDTDGAVEMRLVG